jgi:hypothetical protein
MAYANLQVLSKIYSPAVVGAGETAAVFAVKKGTRVWAAGMQCLVASAAGDSTLAVGDGTATAGFIAAAPLVSTAAGTIVPGLGTLFNQSGGKLYTVDDTVDALYAGTTFGTTLPRYRVWIVVSRESPGPGPV